MLKLKPQNKKHKMPALLLLRKFWPLALVALLCASSFIAAWKICTWKHESNQTAQAQAHTAAVIDSVNDQDKKNLALSNQRSDQLSNVIIPKQNEVNKNAKIETAKPVYSTCAIPADSVQLINAACEQANSSEPS